MKRFIKMRINGLRRWIVNKLLGNDLILEKTIIEKGYKLQLVDVNRKIPYGYWQAEEISDRDTRLSR